MILEALVGLLTGAIALLLDGLGSLLGPGVLADINGGLSTLGQFVGGGFTTAFVTVLVASYTVQLGLQAVAFTINMYKLVPGKFS